MRKLLLIPLLACFACVNMWGDNAAKIGETEYATLNAALTAAQDGDVVTLLHGVSKKGAYTISKSITLDLNGFTILRTGQDTLPGDNYLVAAIIINAEGKGVTIKNGTIQTQTNVYRDTVNNKNVGIFGINATKCSSITIESVNISKPNISIRLQSGVNGFAIKGGTIAGANAGIQVATAAGGTIDGCTIVPTGASAYGIYLQAAGSYLVKNCEITSAAKVIYAAGNANATIENCTITSTSTTAYSHSALYLANKSTATFKSGTMSSASTSFYTVYVGSTSEFTVEGGTIKSPKYGLGVADGAKFIMNGGTIEAHSNAISPIGILVSAGGSATINEGATIDALGVTPSGRTTYATGIDNSGSVVVNGGTIKGVGSGSKSYGCAISTNGTSTTTIKDGVLEANTVVLIGNGTNKTAPGTTINIQGGTLTTGGTTGHGIYHPQAGTLTITGGIITGGTGVAIKSGALTMTGGTISVYGEKKVYEKGWSNGSLDTGAAISIESNGSYAGNMEISVSEAANLESEQGYAFYEFVAYPNDPTKVNSIEVTNGTFDGGISISQSLAAKGGFVSGGTWSKDIVANCVEGKTTAKEGDNYNVVDASTVQVKEETNTVVLVSSNATAAEQAAAESASAMDQVETTGVNNVVVIATNTEVAVAGDNDVVEVKKVTVEEGNTLTVTEGATLMVGTGSVLLDENATTEALVVEAGAALVVDGLVYGSTADNFVIESEEGKPGIVLFSPETEFIKEDHPTATYRFVSKAYRRGAGDFIWQRFGIPTFDGNTTMKWDPAIGTEIHEYDYEADNWQLLNAGNYFTGSYTATNKVPFQCYNMTCTNPAEGTVYEFTGALMGNQNASLNFVGGWNYFANSYTAPISIKQLLEPYKTTDIDATVYVYNRESGRWDITNASLIGLKELGLIDEDVIMEIEPMHAFIISSGSAVEESINYKDAVYDPIVAPAAAPVRRNSVKSISVAKIEIAGAADTDNLILMESAEFSDAYDNGADSKKYGEGALSIYVADDDVHYAIAATDDMNGTYVGVRCANTGSYTLAFRNIRGSQYQLRDMQTNAVVTMSEGAEYTFSAEAGQNDYRFRIETVRPVATGMDNLEGDANIWKAGNTLYVADNKDSNISIFGMNGQLLMDVVANGQPLQAISLDNLSSGAYMVRVADKSLKIVK